MLQYNKKIKLLQCIQERVKLLYGYKTSYLTALTCYADSKFNTVLNAPNSFNSLETEIINSVKLNIEQQSISCIYQFNGFLQKIGSIEYYNSIIRSKERGIAKALLFSQNEISKFSSVLELYTNNSVRFKHISPNSNHFVRCQKVLQATMNSSDFDVGIFSSLCLCAAYKIENSILSYKFEQLTQSDIKYKLKGLYYLCSPQLITVLGTLGFYEKFDVNEFRRNYLRIPLSIFQSIPSTIETTLLSTAPIKLPVYLSPNAMFEKVREELSHMSEDNVGIIHLLLCRCTISDDPSVQIYYSEINRQYEAHQYEGIYPEYMLICKPTLKAPTKLRRPQTTPGKGCEGTEIDTKPLSNELENIQKSVHSAYINFWENVSISMQNILHPMILRIRRKAIQAYQESVQRFKAYLDEIRKLR